MVNTVIPPDDSTPGVINISEYPDHRESFETYYYLGESRTLRETAAIRFGKLFPNCSESDPRFESFYTKIKRWSRKESWKEWVKRKEIEERRAREVEMREKVIQSQRNIIGYRGMLQQGLVVFSRRIQRSLRVMNEIIRVEEAMNKARTDEEAAELALTLSSLRTDLRVNGVEIRNYKEALETIRLEGELASRLDELPEMKPADQTSLTEKEADKVDQVMEWFRKHSGERSGGLEDEEVENIIESEVKSADSIRNGEETIRNGEFEGENNAK